jgi:hypothetical protein
MDRARGVVLATVGFVVVVTIATGPVGLLEISQERPMSSAGEGNASVTVVSEPDQVVLERGRQGGGVYYLRVSDVEVDVTQLRGNPILGYSLSIDALGYSRNSVHFLGNVGTGQTGISLSRDTFDESQIERDTYRAEVTLTLRTNGTKRVIYTETTTVEVEQ